MGKRAPPASSIVGWFCRLPELPSAADSVAPPACHFALVAARAPLGVIREDAQNDTRPATTPDGPEAVEPVGKWPRFVVPEPLLRDGLSDSPVCMAFRHRDPVRGRFIETAEICSREVYSAERENENVTSLRYNAIQKEECPMS